MKKTLKFRSLLTIVMILFSFKALFAWSEHPLMVYPALSGMTQWSTMKPIEAKSLKTFLLSVEKDLEMYLAEQEAWSRANLPDYAPRPDALAFKATGNPNDILIRFFTAIRVNPNIKGPLYLHLLPLENDFGRPLANAKDVTTLNDVSSMLQTRYVWLNELELVHPLSVLVTANDEPDYGFDLGLFEDNKTAFGNKYGFGVQPFGNPNLEYSSQAPFHMGFYHEDKILYKFGAFLKRTSLDYRVALYKSLSEFAFSKNQPYWGWRFMGWGMHYLGDASMPYHSKPLPGVSTMKMIWINLKAMMGYPKSKDDAVQLVSNRHTVFEEFQVQVLRQAHEQNNQSHPLIKALANPIEMIPYTDDFLKQTVAKQAAEASKKLDKDIEKYMPYKMVSDPAVEANNLPELKVIAKLTKDEKGQQAVDDMTLTIAERFSAYSMHMRSYMQAILSKSGV